MNDDRLGQEISDFYHETDIAAPDSKESAREVAARLPQVEQVKRRRWRPIWLTRANREPSPTPANNGLTPTDIGRTTSMLSPVKAITAGALIFAISGVLLIVQPFGQQAEVAPGAEAEYAAPVEVTGTQGDAGCSNTRLEGDEATLPGSDEQYTCTATWTMNDDRLSGRVTLINENFYLVDNGLEASETLSTACAEDPDCTAPDLETFSYAMSVENDGGVWRQRPAVRFSYPGSTEPDKMFLVMDGEQGYDGLVAVLEATDHVWFGDATYYGFILDARQLKAAPENASTQ